MGPPGPLKFTFTELLPCACAAAAAACAAAKCLFAWIMELVMMAGGEANCEASADIVTRTLDWCCCCCSVPLPSDGDGEDRPGDSVPPFSNRVICCLVNGFESCCCWTRCWC